MIRKGMWVKSKGKIGIVSNIDGDFAEVHLVNEKGETTVIVPAVAAGSLKQAALADIPEQRRPSAARAAKFGYE
jgi:hypothetical protein